MSEDTRSQEEKDALLALYERQAAMAEATTTPLEDADTVVDRLEWTTAILGGVSSEDAHRRLAAERRPMPTDQEALEAARRLREAVRTMYVALERISRQQPALVAKLREHGVVFDGPLGNDPKNFQHVAFTIYTDLCEVDMWARQALDEVLP